jgi:hypothetical protein
VPAVADDAPLSTTEDLVNQRAAPGTDCQILQQLPLGTEVTPLSGAVSVDDFLWILVDASGVEGWVASDFLAPAGSIDVTTVP